MTINPTWRVRLFGAGASVLAVWLGANIAETQLVWPSVVGAGLMLFFLARCQPLPLSAVLLIAVTAGYVVGNRGFAQLSFSQQVPLLPAEGVLLVTGGLLLLQSALRQELPFRRDALNLALTIWIVFGSLRVCYDVREYGAMALRDFALVYYAAFFFIGQNIAREPRTGRVFHGVLMAACISLLPMFPLYEQFPDFFFNTLAWNGIPLIFYKGDLVVTFIAVGAVLFFLRFEANGRWRNAAASLALSAAALGYNNRAAMLALFVATVWLLLAGRWRFAVMQVAAATVGIALILAVAAAARIPWQKTPLFGLYERVVSITDPTGMRSYQGAATYSKGDNNLFRAVWWNAVFEETVHQNPWIGLGFGHDLAARFIREYYPDSGEDFNTRSPHNVLLTIFGRMGAVGLAAFLAVIAALAVRTWRAIRSGPEEAALWCAAWVILISACLGVVLEGPMGAVVFWVTVGFANGQGSREVALAAPDPASSDQELPHPIATGAFPHP